MSGNNPEGEVARIIREHTDRIDRLEDERFSEGVPNPAINVEENARTTEAVAAEAQPPGGFSWGGRWGIGGWSSKDQPVFEDGFENGLGAWSIDPDASFSTNTDRAFAGSTSGYATNSAGNGHIAGATVWTGGGAEVSEFQYYFQETSNSTGGGFRLVNSEGLYEAGVATDNPQWEVDSGDGFNYVDGGPGYNVWVRVTVWFDWDAGAFTVEFVEVDGGHEHVERGVPLKEGTDVEAVELWDQTGAEWQNNRIDMWVDDVSVF
jgi:hypothetical protein